MVLVARMDALIVSIIGISVLGIRDNIVIGLFIRSANKPVIT